jgi:hypothetical protein
LLRAERAAVCACRWENEMAVIKMSKLMILPQSPEKSCPRRKHLDFAIASMTHSHLNILLLRNNQTKVQAAYRPIIKNLGGTEFGHCSGFSQD